MRMRRLSAMALLIAGLAAPALAAEAPAAGPPSATAGQDKAARLDALFADLKSAASEDEGKAIERKIVIEWLESGDDETNKLMLQAIIAMDAGALNKAMGLLNTVIAAHPDYAEAWNKRATIYFMINKYDNSLADIEKTLKLEPRHFGALAGLGMIMMARGDKERALAAFQRAYDVDPAISNGKAMIEQLKAELGKNI